MSGRGCKRVGWALVLGTTLQAGCTAAPPVVAEPPAAAAPQAEPPAQHGLASYYAAGFRNRRTASGAAFDPASDTAAHRSLPFGSRARVTNLANGRSTTVTIRDRGPHTPGRILDVSPRIAEELQMRRAGIARVMVQPLQTPEGLTEFAEASPEEAPAAAPAARPRVTAAAPRTRGRR